MKLKIRFSLVALALALFVLPCWATCGGGGGGGGGGDGADGPARVYNVSWQKIGTAEELTDGLSVLWLPGSQVEFDSSPLRRSRALALRGAGCVSMVYAEPDSALAEQYHQGDDRCATRSLAVLIERKTEVLNKVASPVAVSAADVETMLESEIAKRQQSVDQRLSEALSNAKAGENQSLRGRFHGRQWA